MKARFKAITATLALVALVAVAAQAGEQAPRPLRVASVDGRSVEPIRLARAEDSSLTRYPSASGGSPVESPAHDPASGEWAMLLAGFLGAAAIARRRMSS
jgi:MYXO-CTERM domain-containing protein